MGPSCNGASGYVGSHLVATLARRGFDVRACVIDRDDPKKTEDLGAIGRDGGPGRRSLFAANVVTDGSYDEAVECCSAVLHAATRLRGGQSPRETYEGALEGTRTWSARPAGPEPCAAMSIRARSAQSYTPPPRVTG